MVKKFISVLVSLIVVLVIGVSSVSAHVTVKPAEVGVGQRLNFVVSVPTEEDVPTTQIRLVLPEGLQSVRPNAKVGWNIQLVRTGEGEDAKVTEILWSGGNIPVDLRDEFVFSAQAPASEESLVWKAYQTYQGGEIVAWENDPKVVEEYTKKNPSMDGEDDHSAPKPYSVTKVTNDLSSSSAPAASQVTADSGNLNSIFSVVAIVLSAIALGMQILKRGR